MKYIERLYLNEDYDTVRLPRKTIDRFNKIARKYSGYRHPREIAKLWEELSDIGVDVGMFTGYGKVAEDGARSWEKPYEYQGKTVENSMVVYSVYEDTNSDKNDYLIYFS